MESAVAPGDGAEPSAYQDRFWLIELISYWEGRITTGHLCQQFSVSRQQASKVISDYKRRHPENLQYSSARKGYEPAPTFTPHNLIPDAAVYLHWLMNPQYRPASAGYETHCASLALPSRHVEPEIIRALTQAMRESRRVEVDYVSLSNPNRYGRIIVPHSFVNTGLRWHLRAWCEKSGEYRDFVLSRFRGDPEMLGKSDQTKEKDVAWNTQVELVFAPDPRLSPDKREVLERDYAMTDGHLTIKARACLAQYLLQEMGVNTKMLDGIPEAQQLVLVNLVDVKPWLFGG